MAWDADTRHDVADLFALLSVPDLSERSWLDVGGARETPEDVIAKTRARDAAHHRRRIAEDPEFLARRREQWRKSKARAAARKAAL